MERAVIASVVWGVGAAPSLLSAPTRTRTRPLGLPTLTSKATERTSSPTKLIESRIIPTEFDNKRFWKFTTALGRKLSDGRLFFYQILSDSVGTSCECEKEPRGRFASARGMPGISHSHEFPHGLLLTRTPSQSVPAACSSRDNDSLRSER